MIKFKDTAMMYIGETFDVYTQSMYHDDYDYALSFHDGKIVETMISSTAGGTGLEKFEIDITEENQKLLDRYYHRQAVEGKWNHRRHLIEDARKCNCSYHEIKKLENVLTIDEYVACFMLLKTKNFRSKFRESMAKQIREWMCDDNPRFEKPLSEKQFSYIVH